MNRLPRIAGVVALAGALAASLLAGCATTTAPAEPIADTGTIVGEPGDPRNRAKVHTELAALYYGRGSMAIALEELRIAVSADPNYALTYSMFGLVYAELRENQLAQTNFERALSLAPTDPDINHNYGRFLCQTGREDEAIKRFLQAVRNPLYPAPWRSYSAAGTCALNKGRLAEAEDYFQRALRQEPNDTPSLLQLGQIRYRQGSLEDARRLVARYNKLVEPTPESLWLALRIERKLGERVAEASLANQLRRRFSSSREYQQLQRGEYD
ncbi:MAG: type IV pilus biogenesis/stability protein PilW [Betaproteobacteria bacterium]|nr:type IV pilus biogenesis/stability protein PilW [Betaproteobacteria bacterium]